MNRHYQVVVGNIGCVYDGPKASEADTNFEEYKSLSQAGYGRASGEDVSIYSVTDDDMRLVRCYNGTNDRG